MSRVAVDTLPLRFRAGMEARDLDAIVDAFALDAVVHSPITSALTFVGREKLRELYAVILDTFHDVTFVDELRNGETAVVVMRGRVGRTEIEMSEHMRLDADGRITEMTAFFRPLSATAVAARALGRGLCRPAGRTRAAAVSALMQPLVALTKAGDAMAPRLLP